MCADNPSHPGAGPDASGGQQAPLLLVGVINVTNLGWLGHGPLAPWPPAPVAGKQCPLNPPLPSEYEFIHVP